MGPTAHSMGNTGTSRNKCKPKSPFDWRPSYVQFFDRANPTSATQRLVTCRREFVPG